MHDGAFKKNLRKDVPAGPVSEFKEKGSDDNDDGNTEPKLQWELTG